MKHKILITTIISFLAISVYSGLAIAKGAKIVPLKIGKDYVKSMKKETIQLY